MKRIINILILIAVLSNVFVMTSCTTENEVEDSEHQHIFVSTVIEASDKTNGYTSHTCRECGYVYHDAFTSVNYPLHEHDFNPDGTPKKPHWHILFMFDGPTTKNRVKSICEQINAVNPIKIDSARGIFQGYQCVYDNDTFL